MNYITYINQVKEKMGYILSPSDKCTNISGKYASLHLSISNWISECCTSMEHFRLTTTK